ncbi:MAG: M48 family metallopeptidase [Bacteroidales bacterium]|nr:M48 family metallopeptidase [Bacteroidales bacterium]
METLIFWAIIAIIIFDFLSEQFLSYLNNTYRKKPLPEIGVGIYDEKEYTRSQKYEEDKYRFSTLDATLSFIIMLFFLSFGGFPFLDNIVRSLTENPILMALLFFGTLSMASNIISIPFSWYITFVIEERYGFNKTTQKTFFLDILKSWILSAIIGVPLIAFIVWIFNDASPYMWLLAWLVVSSFMLFFNFFYSSLIVPLFNKQKPMEEGTLKEAINNFANKVGFKLTAIYVIDGSKRSAKANAYFSGFGSKKRIVLYDTLIQQLNEEELVAVLAHEIGHYKKNHILKSIVISILSLGLTFFLLSVFIQNPVFSKALGVEQASFHISVITFGILYGFISTFFGLFMNIYSRYNEFEADHFAATQYSADALEKALKKLSVNNLSNLMPHPWFVFVYYSHPPLLERLKAIRKIH